MASEEFRKRQQQLFDHCETLIQGRKVPLAKSNGIYQHQCHVQFRRDEVARQIRVDRARRRG